MSFDFLLVKKRCTLGWTSFQGRIFTEETRLWKEPQVYVMQEKREELKGQEGILKVTDTSCQLFLFIWYRSEYSSPEQKYILGTFKRLHVYTG